MKISTFGSRICDDAIVKDNEIDNISRIVGISPFSLWSTAMTFDSKLHEVIEEKNNYKRNILIADLTKQPFNSMISDDIPLVIDFMNATDKIISLIFENGFNIRITHNETSTNNLDNIEKFISAKLKTKLKKESVFSPMDWSEVQLEDEIKSFASIFKHSFNDKRIILLESSFPYQFINDNICNFSNLEIIQKQNNFVDTCCRLFLKYMDCEVIRKITPVCGSSIANQNDLCHYTNEYYAYINACLKQLQNEKPDFTKAVSDYRKELQDTFDKGVFNQMHSYLQTIRNDRKIILIGCTPQLREMYKSKEITIDIEIEYNFDTDIQILKTEMEKYKNKYDEYVVIVAHIFALYEVMQFLREIGYIAIIDIAIPAFTPYQFNNLKGYYSDLFFNEIYCASPIRLRLESVCSVVKVKSLLWNNNNFIRICDGSTIDIEENVIADTISILGYSYSSIFIGEGTSFAEKCDINPIYYSSVTIGKDCMFSSYINVLTHDGHPVFDGETNQRNNPLGNYKVNLGNHVWVGYQVMIHKNANVGDGSIIGARTLVNKTFPNNCIIAGLPGKVIKKDIAWNRATLFARLEDANVEEYSNYTRTED